MVTVDNYLYYTALSYGLWKVLKLVCQLLCMVYQYLFMKCFSNNLYIRYGSMQQRSWVLVTGATDGIGRAMCLELARNGFNVLMLGRSQEKINQVMKEVRQIGVEC